MMKYILILFIIFFVFSLISVGIVSAADDTNNKEYCAIDVTLTPDARDFSYKMMALSWTNRGKGHALDDSKAHVIWDTKPDTAEQDDKGVKKVIKADLEHASNRTTGANKADFLYFAGHGSSITGNLSYGTGTDRYVASPTEFIAWNDDLEWAVFAACAVLNVDFDSNGWPSGWGVKWAKALRGTNNPAHGLFGYCKSAPIKPKDSETAEAFVNKLKSGKTFRDAWKESQKAGYLNNWAIIMNAKNKNDHLPGKGTVTSDSTIGRLYYQDSDTNWKPITVALSAKSSGAFENKFKKDVDNVWVKGTLLPSGQSVRIYIIKDKTLSDGNEIPSDVRGNYQTHTVSDSTDIFVKIWGKSELIIDKYDIVVDVNANGSYDEDIDIIDSMETVGFAVIPEFPTIAIPIVTIIGLLFLASRRKMRRSRKR